MTFEELRDKCLKDGCLYEDPDFPASYRSLYFSRVEFGIRWKRPQEISSPDQPKFITDGVSRFDLAQSETLGNCWLIAGAAIATSGKDFLSNRVIPLDQGFDRSYAGIFRFRFWQFGKWEEVIIDDRLPVKYDGRLAYCHNNHDPHEYWGALMEKAYAKLNGSYEALNGGWIQDAMVDFTGGVGDTIDLGDADNLPPDLFNTIHSNIHMDTIMGAANIVLDPRLIETGSPNGIIKGHAYSITKTAKVRFGGREQDLIQLRNPWGQMEYNGPWSDGSEEWNSVSERQRSEMGVVNREDGEFWMPFAEFLTSFNSLDMCYLPPENNLPTKQNWQSHIFHSEWVANVSAGGSGFLSHQKHLFWTNPQFTIMMRQEEKTVISLMQKGNLIRRTHLKKANADYAIGFDIYKVRGRAKTDDSTNYKEDELDLVKRTGTTYPGHKYIRQLTLHLTLRAGTYVIIPSTFEINQVGEFLLRVYTDSAADAMARRPANAEPQEPGHNHSQEVPLPPPEEIPVSPPDLTLDEIYRSYSDHNGMVGASELQKILHQAMMTEFRESGIFDLEICREFVAIKDSPTDGLIDRRQFDAFWKELGVWRNSFKQHDFNNSNSLDPGEMSVLLSSVGLRVNRDVVDILMKKYGDHDRRVRFTEFMTIVTKLVSIKRNQNGGFTSDKVAENLLS